MEAKNALERKTAKMKEMGLSSIDLEVFQIGMHVPCGIYYYTNNNFILICCNVIISNELFKRLRQLFWGSGSLYVEKEYCPSLIKQGLALKTAVERLENEVGYQNLVLQARSLLDSIRSTGKVDLTTTQVVIGKIAESMSKSSDSAMLQCVNNVRDVDQYLSYHSLNVAVLNGMIGQWLNLTPEQCQALMKTGLLHDIGKLKVPSEILDKPGTLSPEEYELVKRHPVYSYELLREANEKNEDILHGVLQHHERMTGSGYPNGLTMEDISLFGKVTAISDVYDAMIARRAYRDLHSPFEILEEFSQEKFAHLDIEIVNQFLKNVPLELIGRKVLLSNGDIAVIQYIAPTRLSFPLVNIDGQIIQTSETLKCVCMCG